MKKRSELIAHLRLAEQRNTEPGIKSFEDRMQEEYIELIGSWNVAIDKMNQIQKVACYCGKKRYLVPIKEIRIVNGVKRAYLNHDKGKFEIIKENYGYQLGHKKLGINKFYTDLNELPLN